MTRKELREIINKAAKDKVNELDLNWKKIIELPPEIGRLTILAKLNLGKNHLMSLPPEIGQLTNLKSLDLFGNQLRSLPPEIGRLTNLKSLNLGGNKLRSLPPEIGQLTSLKSLHLGENQLTSLPPGIIQLTNLTSLDLRENGFTSLPPEIGRLKGLSLLNLGYNKLASLPPEFAQLTSLTILWLGENQLTSLPPEINRLTRLRFLELRANKLKSLPPEIGQLKVLTELYLDYNPNLKQPPPEIVKKGTQAILEYLRDLLEGEEKQYRAKLIFVGEGDVGKTCTLHQLKGDGFVEDEETTHGIDIGTLEINHPLEKDIKLNLNTWDFGGQHIYHATHQFFLTKRSLYVLCWNSRKDPDQCEIEYWLRTINSLAPDSPIVLLATHIDERAPDINYLKFKEKYPQLIENCASSNKTGEGIDKLGEIIQKAAADLPQMGEAWPKNWIKVRERIKELKEKSHHISRKEYLDICIELGVDDKSIWILADWLHDLGNILFFHNDAGLEDMVILQPEWITKAISKVLEDKYTKDEKQGILDHRRLTEIWGEYDLALHPAFLRLMEKFDLSYRIHGDNSSVVAELLPYEPPKFKWQEASELADTESQLTMNFKLNFVPAGIMTWFIVRTHRFTKNTHWRDGVYLEHDGHRARAELDTERRLFTLEVQGVMPHYFFSILKDSIDFIFNRFPGLKVERFIPCLCHEIYNSKGQCEYSFDYNRLVERLDKKVDTAQCDESYKLVPVIKLLYGIHPRTDNDIRQVLEDIRKIDKKADQFINQNKYMSELIMRNFIRLHNLELSKLEADCPSLVTITPRDSGVLQSVRNDEKSLFSTPYDVQLWCQMPGCCHPVVDGDYEMNKPKEWLTKIKPWLKILSESIKYIELTAAVSGGFISKAMQTTVKDNIEIMEKLAACLPEMGKKPEDNFRDEREISYLKIGGSDLRMIYNLLHHLDEAHKWGGLRKTISPEGDILWLCPKHYSIFDPGLPILGN